MTTLSFRIPSELAQRFDAVAFHIASEETPDILPSEVSRTEFILRALRQHVSNRLEATGTLDNELFVRYRTAQIQSAEAEITRLQAEMPIQPLQ